MSKTTESILQFSQADWLEAAKLDAVTEGIRSAKLAVLAVIVALGLLMVRHVPLLALGWMLGLTALTAGLCYRFLATDARLSKAGRLSEQLSHARQQWWIWVLCAVTWGLWPLLYFTRLPVDTEPVCWLMVAGVGAMAVSWMAAHLGIARLFLMVFLATVTVSIGLTFWLKPEQLTRLPSLMIVLLLAVYGLVLWRNVRQLNQLYHDSIELSYHNARLIHSLREQTRAAQEAARFKDRFLAGAAHDLKQPVNALGIYAEWLSNEPELVHELGPRILQSTQAINTLFDSLFDLVKLDAGRLELNLQAVDVAGLLSDLEVQYRPMAVQKGLSLRVRSVHERPVTDAIMLRRIVGNLLANAIRYCPKGGVLVAARRRGEGISIEVWDTGIGIAEHEQWRIFEEFYKVPSNGTDEGFGLGLSIVHRLASRLGCQVTVRSRPGRGTMFRVWVPFKPVAQAGVRRSAGHSSGQSAASVSGF